MLGQLSLLVIVILLTDLYGLFLLGDWITFWPTMGIVLGTGALGVWLMRHQGQARLARAQAQLAQGALPGAAVLGGVLMMLSGSLLLLPGVITDAVGLVLLLPPVRRQLQAGLKGQLDAQLRARLQGMMGAGSPFAGAPDLLGRQGGDPGQTRRAQHGAWDSGDVIDVTLEQPDDDDAPAKKAAPRSAALARRDER